MDKTRLEVVGWRMDGFLHCCRVNLLYRLVSECVSKISLEKMSMHLYQRQLCNILFSFELRVGWINWKHPFSVHLECILNGSSRHPSHSTDHYSANKLEMRMPGDVVGDCISLQFHVLPAFCICPGNTLLLMPDSHPASSHIPSCKSH